MRSRKRGVRGAAYTELLAIMPAMIVINMALLHLWNAYAAKQWSMYEARHGAWTPAMTGCQGGGGGGATQGQVTGGTQARPVVPENALEQLQGQLQEAKQNAAAPNIKAPFEQLTRKVNPGYAAGQGWNVASKFGQFNSQTYASQGAVICNEIPKTLNPGDEKKAVDAAYQKYVGQ